MTWIMYIIFWCAFRRDSIIAEGLAAGAHECIEIRNGVVGGRELM
jgi:hypothetical protein